MNKSYVIKHNPSGMAFIFENQKDIQEMIKLYLKDNYKLYKPNDFQVFKLGKELKINIKVKIYE